MQNTLESLKKTQFPWKYLRAHDQWKNFLKKTEIKSMLQVECQQEIVVEQSSLKKWKTNNANKIKHSYLKDINSITNNPYEFLKNYPQSRDTATIFNDFTNFNTSTPTLIYIPKNTSCEIKLQEIKQKLSTSSTNSTLRLIIIADSGSTVEIFENIKNIPPSFNMIIELVLCPEAQVSYLKTQNHSLLQTHHIYSYLYQKSVLNFHSCLTQGEQSVVNLNHYLLEPSAELNERGVYLGKNKNNQIYCSHVYHNAPKGKSSQFYKAVLQDLSQSVFSGMIFINKNCPQVDSQQLNKNLALAEKAHIVSKPQIKVLTDDVQATHGSTTGQINSEEVFYMKTRGIPEQQAKKLLLEGFAMETFSALSETPLYSHIQKILKTALHKPVSSQAS